MLLEGGFDLSLTIHTFGIEYVGTAGEGEADQSWGGGVQ